MTTTELMVCSACDCPTSAHYRAEINAADMNKATALGWTLNKQQECRRNACVGRTRRSRSD
ncbi:MAG: hypothetical protein M5U34_16690 [Chloroflexi bacterium]|nr:hypothetical protein [Chloroflexota bacterium]